MEINKDNYRDLLISYMDGNLAATEKLETEQYINEHDWAAQEWELLQRTRLEPDLSVKFPNKKLLFRTEEPVVELKQPARVYSLYRYAALAAAAAVLAFAIILAIKKPGNKIETAHSDIKKEISPLVKSPEKAQAIVPSQTVYATNQDIKHLQSGKEKTGDMRTAKRELAAKHIPEGGFQKPTAYLSPLGEGLRVRRKIKGLWKTPEKFNGQKLAQKGIAEPKAEESAPVASESTPSPVLMPPVKTGSPKLPKQQLATVQQPTHKHVMANKAKHGYDEKDNNQTVLQSLLGFLHKVSIKREEVNQQTYFALSIETSEIKVNKTFK